MRAFFFPLALATLLPACSDRAELAKVVHDERAHVEPQLRAFESVPGPLKATPPFAAASVTHSPSEPISFAIGKGNAIVSHLEDLEDLRKPGAVPLRVEGTGILDGWTEPSRLKHLLDTGEWWGGLGAKNAKGAAEIFPRLRYVLVVRTHAFAQVVEHGDDPFVPARFEGDAVLVQLSNHEVLGGFPLHVDGRSSLYLKERRGPIKGMRFSEKLSDVSDFWLRADLERAIRAGLGAMLPRGSVLPYQPSDPKARS